MQTDSWRCMKAEPIFDQISPISARFGPQQEQLRAIFEHSRFDANLNLVDVWKLISSEIYFEWFFAVRAHFEKSLKACSAEVLQLGSVVQ